MTKLSIIVLSYNTKNLTCECLKSIFEQYEKELKIGEFEVILVDNASKDGTVDAISDIRYSDIKIIKNKENLGFSKGNNVGVGNAAGKFVLFLNSDTEIKDKGLLKMVEFLDNNKHIAIVGGRMENEDGSVQPSAGKFYSILNLFILLFGGGRMGLLRSSPSRISKADWVSGACMMVKKDIFKKIGGFDEKLFMYMEDVEVCFRARKAGYLTYYYPFISLLHKERRSSNKTFAIVHIYEGILYFFKKYKPKWQYDLAKSMLKTKALALVVLGKIVNNKYLQDTYSQALKI